METDILTVAAIGSTEIRHEPKELPLLKEVLKLWESKGKQELKPEVEACDPHFQVSCYLSSLYITLLNL